MMTDASYSVGDVARFAGVTVRALHHYDRIGLLRPGQRSARGYRRYGAADLERLQRVLCYRELGFGLDEIAAILDDPQCGRSEHLRRQHQLVSQRIAHLRRVAAVLKKTMEAHEMGINLDPDELLEVFGEVDPTAHADEAEERWGDTDAYRESQRRTSGYRKQDWLRMKDEGTEVEQRLAAALAAGLAPDSDAAMDAAEAHRSYIDRWFYEVSTARHRGLGDLYVADARFEAHYENVAPGLAQYLRDAIHANADRREDPTTA